MKVLALALALCFAAAPLGAAVKNKQQSYKVHRAAKPAKMKNKSHVKGASKIKRAKRNKVN
jgi:hypothetical protein